MMNHTKWIWHAQNRVHQFVDFQRDFEVADTMAAQVRISVSGDFVLFLDGKKLLRGQFSDFPDARTYSEMNLALSKGKHRFTIAAYNPNEDFQTLIAKPGGVYFELHTRDGELLLSSDRQWLTRENPAYLRDRIDKVTAQLGFVIGYDARNEAKNPAWEQCHETDCDLVPVKRPVPTLDDQNKIDAALILEKPLIRTAKPNQTYAQEVDGDNYLNQPSPEANGFALIYDLGSEVVGLIAFSGSFTAGTIIDISHGEHLADGRVRNRIAERNFTDRYIAAGGDMRWELPRRAGCRYVQLNIIAPELASRPKVHFTELQLPLPEPARFDCDDPVARQLREHAIRTLRCCMHEHYEDCPWREQALYGYDSRNQILYGYYLWGNYDFAAASLRLMGQGLRPDGLLPLCAPSLLGPPIPVFSMAWICSLYEHYLYSGSKAVYESLKPTVARMIEVLTERFDPVTGLYESFPAPDVWTPDPATVWNFYEWRDGLNGMDKFCRLEAPYNLYLLEAFEALYLLTGDVHFQIKHQSLQKAIHAYFWSEEKQCYLTRHDDQRTHEIVQTLALHTGCVPEPLQRIIVEQLMAHKHIAISTSSMLYLVKVLLKYGEKEQLFVENLIRDTFGAMLDGNSTTLWETNLGEADFDGAGSLCHGWSALPIYYYYGCCLGVRPKAPGFAEIEVQTVKHHLGVISGEVITPFGRLSV